MSKPINKQRSRLMAVLLSACLVLGGCVRYDQTLRLREEGRVVIIHHTLPDSVAHAAPLPFRPDGGLISMTLGGDAYELPFAAADLIKNGWTIDERYAHEKAGPGRFAQGVIYRRENQVLRAVIGNPWRSGDLPLGKGLVTGLEILPQGSAAAADFSLAAGIFSGMTSDELDRRLGAPESSDQAGLWRRQIFRLNGQPLDVYLDGRDKVAGIRLLNPVLPPHISQEAAAEAFTAALPYWGEDPTTGRILVDGEFFRLPGPVSQFFTCGWSVSRGLPSLLPGTESLIQLKKGTYRISVGIRNQGTTILELAESEAFSVRATIPESRLNVQLAHSLKTGISHAQALGFVQIYKPRKKVMDDLIWYEIIRKEFEIRLVVHAVTDTLISIEFKRFRNPWEENAAPMPAPSAPADDEIIP